MCPREVQEDAHRRRCPWPLRASPPRPCGVAAPCTPRAVPPARCAVSTDSGDSPTGGSSCGASPSGHSATGHSPMLASSTRRRSGTPPPSTRGRPRAGAGAGASCERRRHASTGRNHASGRKPRRGDTRLPAACARMGIAVRSSVRSTAGVPGNTPMSGGSDVHRRSLSPLSDRGPKRDIAAENFLRAPPAARRSRARARWATLRYFSWDQPKLSQNSAHSIPESGRRKDESLVGAQLCATT